MPGSMRLGGDGWYKAELKSSRAWEGVGWGHSTADTEDNITSEEGRTPAVRVLEEGTDECIARARTHRQSSGPSEEAR
jgi:hypothetical protein